MNECERASGQLNAFLNSAPKVYRIAYFETMKSDDYNLDDAIEKTKFESVNCICVNNNLVCDFISDGIKTKVNLNNPKKTTPDWSKWEDLLLGRGKMYVMGDNGFIKVRKSFS